MNEVPSSVECFEEHEGVISQQEVSKHEALAFPKLDGILFPLVVEHADVVAPCYWMNQQEVTLTAALNSYYQPMTEENADTVISDVLDFLSHRYAEIEELQEPEYRQLEIQETSLSDEEPSLHCKDERLKPAEIKTDSCARKKDETFVNPSDLNAASLQLAPQPDAKPSAPQPGGNDPATSSECRSSEGNRSRNQLSEEDGDTVENIVTVVDGSQIGAAEDEAAKANQNDMAEKPEVEPSVSVPQESNTVSSDRDERIVPTNAVTGAVGEEDSRVEDEGIDVLDSDIARTDELSYGQDRVDDAQSIHSEVALTEAMPQPGSNKVQLAVVQIFSNEENGVLGNYDGDISVENMEKDCEQPSNLTQVAYYSAEPLEGVGVIFELDGDDDVAGVAPDVVSPEGPDSDFQLSKLEYADELLLYERLESSAKRQQRSAVRILQEVKVSELFDENEDEQNDVLYRRRNGSSRMISPQRVVVRAIAIGRWVLRLQVERPPVATVY